MKVWSLIFFALSLLCIVSCADKEVYYRFQSFHESDWHKDSLIHFEVPVVDSLSLHDVYVEIRNNNRYPYRNLWLFVDFELPSGDIRRDTMECILADDYGKWYGKGLSLFDLTIPYDESVRYPHTGNYKYTLRQAMRDDVLHGISDIGVKIVRK